LTSPLQTCLKVIAPSQATANHIWTDLLNQPWNYLAPKPACRDDHSTRQGHDGFHLHLHFRRNMPAMLCFALGKAPRDNMARESFDSTTRLLSRTPSFSSSNIAIVPTIAMANNGQYGTSLPPVLEPQTEYITTSSREQMVIIVGREDSPNTLRKFHVSRPHVECMGAHWNAAIERNTRIRFRDVRVTKEILFPDDDSNAIRLCLYIAHLSFAKLPKYLSLDDLVNLARVAERYDLNHLIPFAHLENWMAPHSKRLLQPGYEPWLYVAWQFGLEEDFRQLATHLAVTCQVDDRGELLSPTGRRFTEEDYPADVLCEPSPCRSPPQTQLTSLLQTRSKSREPHA
jgi:hypothetical protein